MATLPNNDPHIEHKFPEILNEGYSITSPPTKLYNCIGWAASDDTAWWEPDIFNQHYWPPTAPRNYTPQAYVAAYQSVGYGVCDNPNYEDGYEKVAIYIDNQTGEVKHAARQLDQSTWTSKLGRYYDISHALEGLNGTEYAQPVLFMKRPLIPPEAAVLT